MTGTEVAENVLAAIRAYSDNPSAFLALNEGTASFTAPGIDGVVAYRRAGRYLIQLGGPFAPAAERAALLSAFTAFAAGRRQGVLAVQLQAEDAELYAANGFAVNQIGASYALDLSRFSLRGSKFMRLRNKISRARRSGLVVEEVAGDDPADRATLDEIDRAWLRGKGRHTKELSFLVGERGGALRRLFVGRVDGTPVGYISYSPVYGSRPGWMHDLSRRHPDAPPGVMEAVNATAIEVLRAEGCAWLHFGFTPFTGLDPAVEATTARPLVSRLVRLLAAHGERIYPARTQLDYKEKWGPHAVLPEYIAFHGRPRLGAVWQLLRVTNAI
jgi:lysylphosphatidylglycerol synthetase-like protein (DUF2156 family)